MVAVAVRQISDVLVDEGGGTADLGPDSLLARIAAILEGSKNGCSFRPRIIRSTSSSIVFEKSGCRYFKRPFRSIRTLLRPKTLLSPAGRSRLAFWSASA